MGINITHTAHCVKDGDEAYRGGGGGVLCIG